MAQTTNSQDVAVPPHLPFPIYRLSASRANKYLLYDIETVTWLRATHHILGVQIGGMPQFPQQNLFFGLPLELMPEEVRLLVEKNIAFIVDDFEAHKEFVLRLRQGNPDALAALENHKAKIDDLADQFRQAALVTKLESGERFREKRMKQAVHKPKPDGELPAWNAAQLPLFDHMEVPAFPTETSLFDADVAASSSTKPSDQHKASSWALTPTTSSVLMPDSDLFRSQIQVETLQSRYSVFKQLHDRGYYMTPGLRFGCQFTAYPGDPLRYHSHFLANGVDWDEELDLLDIVGGGRLGTGVKKGYLIGGIQTDGARKGETRTFCIEWGGM